MQTVDQARRAWHEALGVPAQFRDTIANAPTNFWTRSGGSAIVGLTLVAIAIGAGVAAFIGLDSYVHAKAAALAAQTGASLIGVNVGIGPLLMLFGLIVSVGWMFYVVAARARINGFPSFAASSLNAVPQPGRTQRITRWIFGGSVRKAAAKAADVQTFLVEMVRDQRRKWGLTAFVLLLPAVIITMLESNHFWVAGPSGIAEHSMFPPFASRNYKLSEAKGITTGCNHTDNDDILIYHLRVASGEEFGLGSAEPVTGGKLAAIAAIDDRLPSGIEHKRWSHLDRDPLHPACLLRWTRQLDADGKRRVAKLLRIKPGEARTTSAR